MAASGLHRWYTTHPGWLWLLWPLEVVFYVVVSIRRRLYALSVFKSYRPPVPVIIIGNVVVGGTGKTPVVNAVTEYLRGRGWHPGVVSRGYGGESSGPVLVHENSTAKEVGDEPLLIARRCTAPVVVGRNRADAVRFLLKLHPQVDIVVTDDGLQHYALARDVELAVVDGARMQGNGHLLPVGPLREPWSRIRDVDFVIVNGVAAKNLPDSHQVCLCAGDPLPVRSGEEVSSSRTVAAFAGIGNPQRFFETLTALGYEVEAHSRPDHYRYSATDFASVQRPVMMTEKDAVKCADFAPTGAAYLPVEAQLPLAFLAALDQKLATFKHQERK